jgi:hypothetical protein
MGLLGGVHYAPGIVSKLCLLVHFGGMWVVCDPHERHNWSCLQIPTFLIKGRDGCKCFIIESLVVVAELKPVGQGLRCAWGSFSIKEGSGQFWFHMK